MYSTQHSLLKTASRVTEIFPKTLIVFFVFVCSFLFFNCLLAFKIAGRAKARHSLIIPTFYRQPLQLGIGESLFTFSASLTYAHHRFSQIT